VLKAIDSGSENGKICLDDIRKYDLDALISIKTSRHQIQLLFPEAVSIREQEKIIELFNFFGHLQEYRNFRTQSFAQRTLYKMSL
jgi:hypothetical protein